MSSELPIRVLCVDDHPVALAGLQAILAGESGIVVAGAAATGKEALTLFRQLQPAVVIMDLRLPDMSGIEAIRAIRRESPTARFVVLTSYDMDGYIHQALEAGAQAYLFKDLVREELTAAVRNVALGRHYLPTAVASRLYEHAPSPDLTPRERDVLGHMAAGQSNKEIASSLRISEFTVKAHVQNIMLKLKAQDRTHAVTIALRRGLLATF